MNLMDFQNSVVDRLEQFSQQEPEITFQWRDKKSSAHGFLVINSLRGNAAGGGTRVHERITLEEVTTLAKIMEIKFALSGPAIGGAKTGIRLDPDCPDKYGVLERWYKAIRPLLAEYYGTGSDLNTDIHKINQILRGLGLDNSQQGIIHAFCKGDEIKTQTAYQNMLLLNSVVKVAESEVKLAEMVTGYGVAQTVIAYYQAKNEHVNNKRIYVQGAGNVGAAAAYYLHQAGAKIIALTDRDAGVIMNDGLSAKQINDLVCARRVLKVLPDNMSHAEFNKILAITKIDVLIPAAGSNIIAKNLVDKMITNGLELISCGANHPFVEREYCYGLCSQSLDAKLAVIPDFLANMGMARTFYTMMSTPKDRISVEYVFKDIKEIMQNAICKAFSMYEGRLLTASLYDLALTHIDLSDKTKGVIRQSKMNNQMPMTISGI
ncbi:Glu/Leu/Phe/Val dehydrogenase dimerization domain-containing protein [Fastidiosibacter lacustris]|uniref:Glu/Leu/Phe/Val dehydrogenase dimerization domain-containing protein n=1 Tax=Fastidiosibacter lacustris TaxID=2056695 RepID=UPI000E3512E4|nr:Glu/Leu/Phe/Val dehydrogenase dimerization domain-containing protein [Fastidiosibacter lacustris]